MAVTNALVLRGETFTVERLKLLTHCSKFVYEPNLLLSPYPVQSDVCADVLRQFIEIVEDQPSQIVPGRSGGLLSLADEFGFSALARQIREFCPRDVEVQMARQDLPGCFQRIFDEYDRDLLASEARRDDLILMVARSIAELRARANAPSFSLGRTPANGSKKRRKPARKQSPPAAAPPPMEKPLPMKAPLWPAELSATRDSGSESEDDDS
jgi:hypothetical protein